MQPSRIPQPESTTAPRAPADEQERFLRAIFGDETGYLFINANDPAEPDPDKGWCELGSHAYPLQLHKVLERIRAQDGRGRDVYVGAQLYGKPDSRRKEHVRTCPSAWSDADAADPRRMQPEPSVILETSPGRFHAFWRVERAMTPTEGEALSRRIAYAYRGDGADPGGWDLTQVLRVPGTRNHKYPDRPTVRMLKCDPTPIPREAFGRLPHAPAPTNGAYPDDEGGPPVRLPEHDRGWWDGTTVVEKGVGPIADRIVPAGGGGEVDRSDTLFMLGLVLAEAGAAKRTIIEALEDRDRALGYEAYTGRRDGGRREYARIAGKVLTPGARLDVGRNGREHGAGEPAGAAPTPRFTLLSARQMRDRPSPEPLIDGVLMRDALAALVGASGTFKSFIGLDMALCNAGGVSWQGRQVHQGPVVYVSAEGSGGMSLRIKAWEIAHAMPASEHCSFLPEAVGMLEVGEVGEVDELLAVLLALPEPPVLVILDTLARCMVGGDENSSRGMGLLIAGAEKIRRATRATVLLLHHVNRAQGEIRGHSSLLGALDTELKVIRDGGMVTLSCEKQKDAEEFPPIELKRRVVDLEGGRSSVVMEPAPRDVARLSATEGKVLKLLAETFGPEGATSTDWKTVCVGTGMEPRTFFRAKSALVEAKRVTTEDPKKRGARWVPIGDMAPASGDGAMSPSFEAASGVGDKGVVSPPAPALPPGRAADATVGDMKVQVGDMSPREAEGDKVQQPFRAPFKTGGPELEDAGPA